MRSEQGIKFDKFRQISGVQKSSLIYEARQKESPFLYSYNYKQPSKILGY